MRINISIIISIIFLGCAPTALRQGATEVAPAGGLDSARILIRRGMTAEARALLSPNGSMPGDSAALRLWARSFEKEGARASAASAWERAVQLYPDASDFRIQYWRSLTALAQADSAAADSLHAVVRGQGDVFATGASLDSMTLAHAAAALLEDTVAAWRADRLIQAFPDSQISIDLVGERFWDGLYPIWNDNRPRIEYLAEFIEHYPNSSWKHPAWRMMIGICAGLGDTAAVMREASRWIQTAPQDPSVLYSAATFAFDFGGDPDSARAWAESAYQWRDRLSRPPHNPEEEWLLYGPQIKSGIPLRLAEVRLRDGDLEAAHRLAVQSLSLAEYGVDEYGTPAQQHYLLGGIAEANKAFDLAAEHWIQTLICGDVSNYFPARADSCLRALFGIADDRGLLALCREREGYDGIKFTRMTDSVGLGEARGSRVAWGDYDGDGDDDLLAGGRTLLRNDGGRFTDVTEASGITADGCHGGIWGDCDGDGDLDLFCFSSSSDSGKGEKLYHNRGDGTFEDVTAQSGEIADTFSTEAAIWGDFNGDGRLDLFAPGYERPYGSAAELGRGWPDRLLIQDSTGVFQERSAEFGVVPPDGRHLCGRSPVACDFDRDGDLDLYVGNYRLQENLLWINRGNSSPPPDSSLILHPSSLFINLAPWYMADGEEVDGWWGHTIGCQWGDFDADGDFDLIACNLAHPRYIGFSNRTMLYRNDGPDRSFAEVRRQWSIKYDECHSEPCWGDFDADGDLDLYITCVYPNRRSYLYRNDGDHFTDVTYLSGTRIFDGWGCAASDYDDDGDLDLTVCAGGKVELFRNDAERKCWAEMQITNAPPGTVIEVFKENMIHIRQMEGGKGAGSQCSPTFHFGLKDSGPWRFRITLINPIFRSDGIIPAGTTGMWNLETSRRVSYRLEPMSIDFVAPDGFGRRTRPGLVRLAK